MKKIIKNIIPIIVLIILSFSTKVSAVNKESTAQYRSRTVNIFGIEITFKDKEYFNGENNEVTDKDKETNNKVVGIFCGFLVIYWIVLLIIFEKEDIDYYTYENTDDIATLKKYNPLIAGCIVDNREVLPRDITAVILNLVQKQAINMKMIPKAEGQYEYMLSENQNSNAQLDETERYVLNWILGFYEQEEIELTDKLKEISTRKDFFKKLKELNKLAQLKLNKMGANLNKVHSYIKIANVFLIVISVIMSVIHIVNNGLDIHLYETTMFIAALVLLGIIIILPVVAFIIHVILILIASIKRMIKVETNQHSGKQIVSTSALILITIFILISIIYFISPNKYICLDIFMIGLSILIVRTDNLMTKHNKEIINDYYALNEIKYRLSEYTLMESKEIKDIRIWEEYLVYAISFGIPEDIINKLKDSIQEDKEIKYLLKADMLYNLCKAYLEVMLSINFKEKNKKSKYKNIFKKII